MGVIIPTQVLITLNGTPENNNNKNSKTFIITKSLQLK